MGKDTHNNVKSFKSKDSGMSMLIEFYFKTYWNNYIVFL